MSGRHRHRISLTNGATAITIKAADVLSGPSNYYFKIGVIPADQSVQVIGPEKEFWKINYKGQDGYIKSQLLSVPGIVTALTGLNIRETPSTIYTPIGALAFGSKINILEIKSQNNGIVWYRISEGWVCGEYVSICGESSYPKPPTTGRITDSQMQKMGWSNYNLDELNECIKKFDITTPQRMRHFIAQCTSVSVHGTINKEMTSGSAYEGKQEIGNIYSNDGPKYKGAGYLQMRGRYLYQKFANYMGDQKIMDGVDYVASKYPWRSAGFLWKIHNMNNICDKGVTLESITKIISGDCKDIGSRRHYYNIACQVF